MRIFSSPNKDQDHFAWWVYLVVLLTSCLLFFVGHLAGQHYGATHFSAIFLKELAFAGVIALILIVTIERFNRRRHELAADALVKRISDNLFHAIYERYVPPAVFKEVEKALLRANVFRQEHKVYYTLDILDDPVLVGPPCGKYIRCKAQASYPLTNITGIPIVHPVKLNIERPPEREFIEHCKIVKVEINGRSLSPEEIRTNTTGTDIQICFRYDVSIKPGEKIQVYTDAELVKRDLDQEIWTSMLPSDGIELTVTVPAKNLEIKAHALHMEEVKVIQKNDSTTVWSLKHGMFPFQSVVFWWCPRQENRCPVLK